jgi:hypothetical protein
MMINGRRLQYLVGQRLNEFLFFVIQLRNALTFRRHAASLSTVIPEILRPTRLESILESCLKPSGA